MATLYQLLHSVAPSAIMGEFRKMEPYKPLSGFAMALKELLHTEPAASDVEIYVDSDEYRDAYVHGWDGEEFWALELMSWSEWLGSEIGSRPENFSDAKVIAECIWEMTFCGFSAERVAECSSALSKIAEEIE